MDGNVDIFCFESNCGDRKVKLEENGNEISSSLVISKTENYRDNANKFQCHLCNEYFDQFELEMHFLECHPQNSNDNHIVISDDHEVMSDNIKVMSDEEVKSGKNLSEKQSGIKCPVCGKSEKTREDMERHIKNHPLESLMAAVT